MTISLLAAVMLLAVLCAGCNNASQNLTTPLTGSDGTPSQTGAAIRGLVVDGDSLIPLDRATVTIELRGAETGSSGSASRISTTTDAEGIYLATLPTQGSYSIAVTRRDYEPAKETVHVGEGQTITQDIAMESSADDWLEQGTVYNWQVEAVQADGTVIAGPVWNFTTESARRITSPEVKEPVDREQAKTVARAFLESRSKDTFTISSMEPIANSHGSTLAYAWLLNPAGYVIVPASRASVLPPVLAYSFTSSFSTHEASSQPLLAMIRSDIGLRLTALSERTIPGGPQLERNSDMWERYLSGKAIAFDSRAVTGPHLYTPTWGQRDPYNRNCPMDPDPDNPGQCVTGCVATAYAQILNYWHHPTSVNFTSADDYTTRTRSISINALTANFTGLNYSGGYPGDDAKAQLCFAMGVLARMNYTSKGSLAYTLEAGKSLTRFGYTSPLTKTFGVNDTLDTAPLVSDLKASPNGRPVAMAISKVDDQGDLYSGHAIVCDGYDDSNGTYHLNMGWNGSKDGWYVLPAGMPSDYTLVKGYVYNLSPAPRSEKTARAARGTVPSSPYPEVGENRVSLDEELLWDDCDNAVSYNCYMWKASEQKPAAPTFRNLPYAAANPLYSGDNQ
jgi:hypothetical protein